MDKVIPTGTRVVLRSTAKRYEGGPATIIDYRPGYSACYRVRKDMLPRGMGKLECWVARGEFEGPNT